MTRENLKQVLLSTVAAAALAVVTMPAHALSLGISGQINRVAMQIDNGPNSALGFFDNSTSGTRFRFTGKEDMGNGWTVGGVWEWQWQNTPSSGTSFTARGEFADGSASLSDRKTDIYFQADFGKISFGKGDGAANGTSEVDLSGTSVADYSGGSSDLLGSIVFGTSGITVGSVHNNLDGLSRNSRIRYDSPKFGGISVAGSFGNEGKTEFAARGSFSFGASKLAFGAGIVDNGDDTPVTAEFDQTAFSVAFLMDMGLNFAFAMGSRDDATANDLEFNYFKVGWKKGKHALSLSLYNSEQAVDLLETTAVAYVFKPAKAVEVYALWRTEELQGAAVAGGNDVDAIGIGTRIKWK
jgi:predicted porin